MNIYSYVITHDTGFAPNPFGDFLTLATCKPRIRDHARPGDWIIGTGSASTIGNNKLVYAARITESIPIEQYGKLPEFEIKRPSKSGEWWRKHGDNIYYLDGSTWKQRDNPHHSSEQMDRDLNGRNVLICQKFNYFGKDAIDIPSRLSAMIKKGPNCKKITDPELQMEIVNWLDTLPGGLCGDPEMEDAVTSKCGQPAPERINRNSTC